VSAVVLDIDSGGGAVSGIPELASEIFAARGSKPIKAVSNTMMASAALWLGSAADEVIVSPSSETGSVGVVAAHSNMAKAMEMAGVETTLVYAGARKVEGNPYGPLDDEARAELQRRVDEAHQMFVRDLAKFRRVGVETVRTDFGEGRVFGAREAIRRGMADREGTIDEVIAELASPRRRSNAARADRARMLTI
jgi:capsid assembly protease